MRRIDTATKAVDLFGAGKHGFKNGDPNLAILATKLNADWFNALQEELAGVVEASGQALVPGTYNQLLLALRAAGVFTTAAQFDTSTKAATMEALQRALGNLRSETAVNSSTTLSAAAIGQLIVGSSASPFTTTLPLAGSVPAGSQIHFQATSPITTWIIQRQGTDLLDNNGGAAFLTLGLGDAAVFESNGSGTWRLTGGSAALRKCADFGSSLAIAGRQRLPGGLLMQWGSAVTGANGGAQFTYPVVFPNAVLNCSVIPTHTGASLASKYASIQSDSISTANLIAWINAATAGVTLYFIVIGY